MYGVNVSAKATRCRSVSVPIGERPPIALYFCATGIERRDEISFAMGRRNNPNGPSGIMSGSRNRFRRNGSTASSESGPPSWNRTMPIRFFPANLLPLVDGILQPLDLIAQSRGALRHAYVEHEEHRPANEVGRKDASEMLLHKTSASRR